MTVAELLAVDPTDESSPLDYGRGVLGVRGWFSFTTDADVVALDTFRCRDQSATRVGHGEPTDY